MNLSLLDISELELRVSATAQAGSDIHRATAAEVFGKPLDEVSGNERRVAKAINFGLMYGFNPTGEQS